MKKIGKRSITDNLTSYFGKLTKWTDTLTHDVEEFELQFCRIILYELKSKRYTLKYNKFLA